MRFYVTHYFIWFYISSSESPAADTTEDCSLFSEQTTESSTEQLIMVTPRGRSDSNTDAIKSSNHKVIIYNFPFLQFCTRIARSTRPKACILLLTESGPSEDARNPKLIHLLDSFSMFK